LRKYFFVLFLALGLSLSAQDISISWRTVPMDGSRTGVTASNADDVTESMGYVKGRYYIAPNGRKFMGSTKKAAKILIGVQPEMAEVKSVIAYSTRAMVRESPECELYDWFIDEVMRAVEDSIGLKVDIGFANKGGVRVDMPAGPVMVDDIMSMFPFRNHLYYVALRGRDVRVILEQMAGTTWQIVGGCRAVVKDGRLAQATVGGEPLDDERLYGIATIDFLLDGGDDFHIEKNAEKKIMCNGYIIDTMLSYVKELTAKGKPIEYECDGRIKIIKGGKEL
jgi:hypothetical protein